MAAGSSRGVLRAGDALVRHGNQHGASCAKVLLSFAPFEREGTAERIRDKIAASKRKGLWMGGNVPLGYEVDRRTLKIDEDDAKTIEALYGLYLEHGPICVVKERAEVLGPRSRKRVRGQGASPEVNALNADTTITS